MENKSKLRNDFLGKRLELSDYQAKDLSHKIILRLIDYIDWRKINTINIYRAIKSKKEVDASGLLDFLRKNHPEINICLTPNSVVKSKYIPKDRSYDLIIVPVVSFDKSGNRLGYGGGYYDKFLAYNHCKHAIGLAYSFQEVTALPIEKHDKKLNSIITESEIIKT